MDVATPTDVILCIAVPRLANIVPFPRIAREPPRAVARTL